VVGFGSDHYSKNAAGLTATRAKENSMRTKVNELINGKYRYFAFICYAHADQKAAEKLYRKLQHYRLPNRLMNTEGRVKRLVPLFWDQRELYGVYREADRLALRESKYLIVVCSRNLHEHDKEVNQEITDFLAAGNPAENIIPFIVDRDEKPELNCFPAKLREICGDESIIGHNIFEHDGKQNYRAALLKTVAQMQGIAVSELENEDHRRRRRMMYIRVFVTALLITIIAVTYHFTVSTRFHGKLSMSVRYVGYTEWEKELSDARDGDIVEFQVEFRNSRGYLSSFLSKIADSNDLQISSDNIMIRAILPDNLEYMDGSTVLYNSVYQEGVRLLDDTVTTSGINIGSYMINGNAYIRFICRVGNENLEKGDNILITWVNSTVGGKVDGKDNASIRVSYK